MQRTCNWIKKAINGTLHGSPVDKYLVVQGVSIDSRTIKENQLYVPLVGERFDGHHFVSEVTQNGAAAMLWQSTHPLPEKHNIPIIVVEDTLVALQELALAYRRELPAKIIGITGSNGKTTTKDIVSSLLSVKYKTHKTTGNLNNHIGVPLTLLSIAEDTEMAVVEMGMNHAGEISILSKISEPDMVAILNVGESHLEFLGSREAIAKAKLEIVEGLKADGTILFDGDEPLLFPTETKSASAGPRHGCKQPLENDKHKRITIGWGSENDFYPHAIEQKECGGNTFKVNHFGETIFRLPLIGKHNVKNALFAIAIAHQFGIHEDEMNHGFQTIERTGMRLEITRAENGMKVINDTYNTSPTSMKSAIRTLSEIDPALEKWVLLGDMAELGKEEERYHREIGEYLIDMKISRIYTVGDRGYWISDEAQKNNQDSTRLIQHFENVAAAEAELLQQGHSNVVLLIKSSRGLKLERVVSYLTKGRVE